MIPYYVVDIDPDPAKRSVRFVRLADTAVELLSLPIRLLSSAGLMPEMESNQFIIFITYHLSSSS